MLLIELSGPQQTYVAMHYMSCYSVWIVLVKIIRQIFISLHLQLHFPFVPQRRWLDNKKSTAVVISKCVLLWFKLWTGLILINSRKMAG